MNAAGSGTNGGRADLEVEPTLASTLQLLAEGVIEFSGFALAAIGVVAEGELHTVAVVGDADAVAQLADQRSPVDLVEQELASAQRWGSLCFVPAEDHSGLLDDYHWVPDVDAIAHADAWQPMDLLCGLLRDEEGRLRGLLSVDLPTNGLRPDTEQRATLQMYVRLAERALLTALERGALEIRVEREHQAAEYRRSIIDVLTHELRGTSAAIANTVEMLRSGPELDDDVATALGIIDVGADRIRSVVDDMSVLAELDRAKGRLRSVHTDLSAIARDSVALHSAGAHNRDVTIVLDIAAEAVLLGDPVALDPMVGNLVSNAIKYSDPGGHVVVRIETRPAAEDRGPQAVLTVADTGLGIAPADRERIFEAFFRSRDSAVRRRSGAGLGLAIVDQVVALHDGTVSVDSEPGVGSTFTVELPLVQAEGPS